MNKLKSIKVDNIVDNHNLLDRNRLPHDDLIYCIEESFKEGHQGIFIDFTSITFDEKIVLDYILYISYTHSQTNDVYFLITPYSEFENYLELLSAKELAPLIFVSEYGNIHWGGKLVNIGSILDNIISENDGITIADLTIKWGEQNTALVIGYAKQSGSIFKFENDKIVPKITINEIKAHLIHETSEVVFDCLLKHNALFSNNHFIIEENGIHTDVILDIKKLISNSNKSIQRIIYRIRESLNKIEYNTVLIDSRLKTIRPVIEMELNRPVNCFDAQSQTIDYCSSRQQPCRSKTVIIDSIIRTALSVETMIVGCLNENHEIVGVQSLFGYRKSYHLKEGLICHPVIVIQSNDWQDSASCPLCQLKMNTYIVNRSDKSADKIQIDSYKRLTPYHFWEMIFQSTCATPDSKEHFIDYALHDYGHCFTYYFDLDNILKTQKALQTICRHLFSRLIHEIGLERNKLRYIVFKESPGARTLAEGLRATFNSWVSLIPISSTLVSNMQREQNDWPDELVQIADKLKGNNILLIDDAINTGRTLNRFHKFFKAASIKHKATAIVIDRTRRQVPKPEKTPDVIEVYRPGLPVWTTKQNCQICHLYDYLVSLYEVVENEKCLEEITYISDFMAPAIIKNAVGVKIND